MYFTKRMCGRALYSSSCGASNLGCSRLFSRPGRASMASRSSASRPGSACRAMSSCRSTVICIALSRESRSFGVLLLPSLRTQANCPLLRGRLRIRESVLESGPHVPRNISREFGPRGTVAREAFAIEVFLYMQRARATPGGRRLLDSRLTLFRNQRCHPPRLSFCCLRRTRLSRNSFDFLRASSASRNT